MTASASSHLFINGRFLTKKVTGTERFALEIVRSLDDLLDSSEHNVDVTLVVPLGTLPPQGLKNIAFLATGRRHGHMWEQADLYCATRSGFLLNPGASGPLFKRDQLTIIHDAAVYRRPQNFSFAYRTWHRLLGLVLARFSFLGTVSAFSQGELAKILHVPAQDILIVHNGHEHILTLAPDFRIIEKLGLENKPYLLFVGSPTPNKNLARAIQAFQLLGRPDVTFVIVGAAGHGLFQNELGDTPSNVLMTGRLTDGEIVGLYRHATAMVFPSIYEGFGIPPLEAMAHGCPVIASKIPAVEEVCGDAALYFSPLKPQEMVSRMREVLESETLRTALRSKGTDRFKMFSWKHGARKIWDFCNSRITL